jgi:cytoskeletal protein RodZ
MATTEQFYTGNSSTTTYAYTFPILQNSDLKVELDGVLKTENTSGTNNDYSISGTNVVLNSAPANGVDIHIYRVTDVDSAKAVFAAGSSIRAGDLNNNVDQSLYANQEQQQKIKTSDIRNDAITGDKIADDQINSEHYVAGSIDHEHLANDIIDGDNIQNDVINSEHYVAD